MLGTHFSRNFCSGYTISLFLSVAITRCSTRFPCIPRPFFAPCLWNGASSPLEYHRFFAPITPFNHQIAHISVNTRG